MLESEAFLEKEDPKMERMYIATGYGLIQCVKGLMSYEDHVGFSSSLYLSLRNLNVR